MTPFLDDDLKADEGLRLRAYPDPKSGHAPWTIGWGHTGLDVHPGLEWVEEQAEIVFRADRDHAIALLDRYASWWRKLNDARQDVMVRLMFNMGWGNGEHGLSSFKHTLPAIRAGHFEVAAGGLLNSQWARDVKSRAVRMAEQMRTGERAAA